MSRADTENAVTNYIRTNDWLRRELRKAANLPMKQMIPRVRELVQRAEALGREVSKFMERKDTR